MLLKFVVVCERVRTESTPLAARWFSYRGRIPPPPTVQRSLPLLLDSEENGRSPVYRATKILRSMGGVRFVPRVRPFGSAPRGPLVSRLPCNPEE